jgi:hypothetical protein
MDYLDIEEELVNFAEVSGFDLETGKYLKNVNLLSEDIIEEKRPLDILDAVKSVFIKPKEINI